MVAVNNIGLKTIYSISQQEQCPKIVKPGFFCVKMQYDDIIEKGFQGNNFIKYKGPIMRIFLRWVDLGKYQDFHSSSPKKGFICCRVAISNFLDNKVVQLLKYFFITVCEISLDRVSIGL